MSMLVSFVLSFFPRDVLDEILNLIGSVSEGFPAYSSIAHSLSLSSAHRPDMHCFMHQSFFRLNYIFNNSVYFLDFRA